jgi:predicted N-formylglutamate amidohydrolase
VTRLPYRVLGQPEAGKVLIIGDHASNHVPADLKLRLEPSYLERHIAWDIGVAAVAELMVCQTGFSAFLGNVSRLVVDLNRDPDEPAVIPESSDGVEITANRLDNALRAERLATYYHPYHLHLACVLAEERPGLILSLHSFTPCLNSQPKAKRPWEIGVLYNEQEAASKMAVGFLESCGLFVGDQLPYSGKMLNATMNRHAEGNNIPYIGIEMRQDLVGDEAGQARFAQILTDMCHFVLETLGLAPHNP